MPITEKQCSREECGCSFYGTSRAKYCSDYCRVRDNRDKKKVEKLKGDKNA